MHGGLIALADNLLAQRCSATFACVHVRVHGRRAHKLKKHQGVLAAVLILESDEVKSTAHMHTHVRRVCLN